MINQFQSFRAWLLTSIVEGIKPIYAVLFQRKKMPWCITHEQLRRRAPGTLGRSLADFLDDHRFELLPLYESHDVYHILLGFQASVKDEAAMQCWLLGNRKYSPAVLVTVVASVCLLPEYSRYFYRAFRRGRVSYPIRHWQFEHLLHEPLELLQAVVERRVPPTAPLIY